MFTNNKGLIILKVAAISMLVLFVIGSNTEGLSEKTILDLASLYALFKGAFYARLLSLKAGDIYKEVEPFIYVASIFTLSYVYREPISYRY